MSVFRVMLKAYGYGMRWLVFIIALAAFAMPLAFMRILGSEVQASDLGRVSDVVGMFPFAAGVIGVIIAWGMWQWDFEGGHVYALSLPTTRWEYSLLKLAVGAVLLLAPATLFWIGALVGTGLVELSDPVLRTFPGAVSLRFLLAMLLVYAAAFAIAAGTRKTITIIVFTLILLPVTLELAAFLLGIVVPGFPVGEIFGSIWRALNTWPGPLAVLSGNWMLVDF